MQLDKILQSQGIGSRKHCQQLIRQGHVRIDGQVIMDVKAKFETTDLTFSVFAQDYLYREQVYIALNKPQNYECSHRPQQHLSVFDFFPDELLARNIQTVGRLDQDTTGLLLFTDDGQFLHQLTHPRKHVSKYYIIETENEITQTQIEKLAQGVSLKNEKGVFAAHSITQLEACKLRFAIDQGVYHQVKRMLHAVDNEVIHLHRDQIGQLTLEQLDLAIGEWCYLSPEDVQCAKTS
ncbi:MAG: rRNA pseudouridine synthase [Acinetobacter populi]|uniref:pseudouridine synthase n=1 Tax=Acinetobacter populi TaxID=1582270 RepID=UPI002355D22F|nr:pseudouridine synthase [Acinetobacter populi]MCH4247467.1 rRNA pseudouridine synthase [Acinetobacter populi]